MLGPSHQLTQRFFLALKNTVKLLLPQPMYPSSVFLRWVRAETNNRVYDGPFEGMKYVDKSIWGAHIPKLLGIYEKEVQYILERCIEMEFEHVIDIGGAEGYYAVGMLQRMPDARLTVFEMLEDGREMIEELATRNQVLDRLVIAAECTPEKLQSHISRDGVGLIICDVEGYEAELIDPAKVAGLKSAHLLVEVHDHRVEGCTDILRSRFSDSHEIVHIEQQPRSVADYPFDHPVKKIWPGAVEKYALNEFRDSQTAWLWMEPR